ncbi:MAG: universal stress protein [Bacteroidetes bacterium]|nr:universal stress protein [Bacteroidota bacterium]
MAEIKKILVPTDFSENAENALQYALQLAFHFESNIQILNTYKLIQRAGSFLVIEKLYRSEAKRDMITLLKKTKRKAEGTIKLEGKIKKGETVSTIVKTAKKEGVDMIVMGTQGASGLKEVFVGSTTGGIISKSKTPVLAIPSGVSFSPFQKIVFAVDTADVKKKTLEPLSLIAKAYNAQVWVLHVYSDNTKVPNIDPSVEKSLDDIEHKYYHYTGQDINVGINQFVKEQKADLLCMISRKKGFYKKLFGSSVTQKAVFHCSVPLLILYR